MLQVKLSSNQVKLLFFLCASDMAPQRRNSQPSQGDAPDIVRAIEAMVVAMTQQSTTMMQQHEASMQWQATSLEQQHLVMQQMEATRVAVEDAHRQHMEACRQL